jgi:serine/threonine protein kinase
MPTLPDLVKDWKLRTAVKGDITRHLIETSGRTTSQRKVRIEQQWRRTTRLGEGSFGVVWKEVLIEGKSESKERAVKVIRKRAQKSKTLDYSRELEAIAKFSHPKVSAQT